MTHLPQDPPQTRWVLHARPLFAPRRMLAGHSTQYQCFSVSRFGPQPLFVSPLRAATNAHRVDHLVAKRLEGEPDLRRELSTVVMKGGQWLMNGQPPALRYCSMHMDERSGSLYEESTIEQPAARGASQAFKVAH